MLPQKACREVRFRKGGDGAFRINLPLETQNSAFKRYFCPKQDLVEDVATYFQNLDPDIVMYVPKCTKDRFE